MKQIPSTKIFVLFTVAVCLLLSPIQGQAGKSNIAFNDENHNCDEYFDISYDFINLEDPEIIIEQGIKLLASGYPDKRIYHHLAYAHSELGNIQETIKTLKESIKHKYICGLSTFPGSEKVLVIDYALAHYHLFELLTDTGETKEANQHLSKAEEILKDFYKDNYSEERKDKIFKLFSFNK